MNFRTTYLLAIALLVVVLGLYLVGQRRAAHVNDNVEAPPTGKAAVQRSIIGEDFGDVVKIVCRVGDEPEWVFQAEPPADAETFDAATASWKMVAPVEAKVQDWAVRDIASRIKRLQYAIAYQPDQPGAVTAAEAGLQPPHAVVTLANRKGKTVQVRLGRDASPSSGYVQLQEGRDIYLVDAAVKRLLKDRARDYWDRNITDFPADKVVRLEVETQDEDGHPVTYALVKQGTKWVFESPFKADAVDAKVREAIAALSRLNVSEWVADTVDKPGLYGLDHPHLVWRATVEETVEPEKPQNETANDNAAQPPPEPEVKTVVHEVRISDLSPIGDDQKVYVQPGDRPVVATVSKSAIEKLEPVIREWRDMRVVTADVTSAERIEMTVADESATVQRESGLWHYVEDAAPADATQIRDLLSKIKELKAENFVTGAAADPDAFGLKNPQGDLVLTLPGQDRTERITVGGFTDAHAQRLVYVRRDDEDTVAKVRVTEVKPLLRSPLEYRDRQVFNFPTDQLERIDVARPDEVQGGRFEFALAKTDDGWKLAEPVTADAEQEAAKKLAADLASLRAIAVVAVSGDPAEYGLDDPAIAVTLTIQPPEVGTNAETDIETEPGTTQPTTSPSEEAETYVPPAETYELRVSLRDGTVYAQWMGSDTIYSIDRKTYDALMAEYHARTIFQFEASDVLEVSVTTPNGQDGFVKDGGQWKYVPEPDLPIDAKRVDNLLVQIADLKAERYVAYGADELGWAGYGLSDPSHTLTVRTAKGETTLRVSPQTCDAIPGGLHYAVLEGTRDVFLVSPNTIRRFTISIDGFEAK
jgi:hypothetical protein